MRAAIFGGATIRGFLAIFLLAGVALAQHPGPQPRPAPSTQTVVGDTTFVVTDEGQHPSQDPFLEPPGSNFLETLYVDMLDGLGAEMPNTLPSTPDSPYNLHDGPVEVSAIDPTSPSDDLRMIFREVYRKAKKGTVDQTLIQLGIDILEGNPIPSRLYSGIAMLHYTAPERVRAVVPTLNAQGEVIGGNVDVRQIWWDSHIESDTSMIDPSAVLDVPWTITYTVDVLERGHDDFSPMVMYLDDPSLSPPGMPPMPHVAMDQTFFPMEDGTRNVFKIKMTPGKYYNLTYTWGWRIHPPRVQVTEKATKVIAGKSLVDWEVDVFGATPRASREEQLAAIAMIGDRAPAKLMWRALTLALDAQPAQVPGLMQKAALAFEAWLDRTKLPSWIEADPDADATFYYVNNTIYGEMKGGGDQFFEKWRTRPTNYTAALINGDYFDHAYMSVDFGGSRGWENQFQSTVAIGGSGCWFTFGRFHWFPIAGAPPWGLIITVPAATDADNPGRHNVDVTLNFEPSRRLRIYQFDPLHHEMAVWSIH